MTKIVTLTKKPTMFEEVSEMLEAFVESITDAETGEASGVCNDLSCVVLMYRTNDGDVTFECTTNATPESVGMRRRQFTWPAYMRWLLMMTVTKQFTKAGYPSPR